jgi:hypothetical protein
MRLWGKDVLTEGFTWTPNQLLAMINEVDKICPEENSFEPQTADQRQNSTEDEATHE